MYEWFQSRVKRQRINFTVFLHNFRLSLRQSLELTQCHMKCVIFCERFTWSIISDIPYLNAVAVPLQLAERKMTCLNLEKCVLLYRIFEKKMTLLPVNTQALASQNKIVFSSKAYLSQWKKSTQFRCARSVHGRIGKERAGPSWVFHCIRPMACHAASRQNAHGRGCL